MSNYYRLSMPLLNSTSTPETRPLFISELKRAGADRVFICPGSSYADDGERRAIIAQLKENIAFYRSNGFETGVWINGLGHGGSMSPDSADYKNTLGFTRIKGLFGGGEAGDSLCPLDGRMREVYYGYVRDIASLHPDMIMIDDDLRLSLHGAVNLGCACELHMKEYCRRLGREISRDELASKAFGGGDNEYRRLWLELMGDTLRDFCRGMREAVDEADSGVRLGHCACLPTWDTDGADSIELSRILAGGTKPFLRFIGAPYWQALRAMKTCVLGDVIELERMQEYWCRKYAPDIEIFSEGDVFPRPRYIVPASYLEGFDSVLCASGGMDGILKYMIDYGDKPLYETGYVDHHVKNRALREEITASFSSKTAVGVHIFEPMHKLRDYPFDSPDPDLAINLFLPASERLMCAASLPITYERDGSASVVFGGAAEEIDDYYRSVPLILDAKAALILAQKGIDTGFLSCERFCGAGSESFGRITVAVNQGAGIYKIKPRDGAKVLSFFNAGGESIPSAYLYENASGQRMLVYAFDSSVVDSAGVLFHSYSRQEQLLDALEWLNGKKIDASLTRRPGAYLMCKRSGDSLAVGIWNFYPDYIINPVIDLSRSYSKIKFIGETSGTISGDRVTLTADIPPYSFAGFEVRE